MSSGAERRMENRLQKLEAMIKDPRSAVNLESLLVSLWLCIFHEASCFVAWYRGYRLEAVAT